MSKVKKLKYSLLTCALEFSLLCTSTMYIGKTIKLQEQAKEVQIKMKSFQTETESLKESANKLKEQLRVNELEEITLNDLLEIDLDLLINKEKVVISPELFSKTKDECEKVLHKLSKMKSLKYPQFKEKSIMRNCLMKRQLIK